MQLYGIYPFGAVKTHTSRFPVKELEAACGPASGDWAVMETTVLGDHKLYAIAHRRGGAVRNLVLYILCYYTYTPPPPHTYRYISS